MIEKSSSEYYSYPDSVILYKCMLSRLELLGLSLFLDRL